MSIEEMLEKLRQAIELERATEREQLARLRQGLTNVRTRVMSLSLTTDRHHSTWNELQSLNHDLSKLLAQN